MQRAGGEEDEAQHSQKRNEKSLKHIKKTVFQEFGHFAPSAYPIQTIISSAVTAKRLIILRSFKI